MVCKAPFILDALRRMLSSIVGPRSALTPSPLSIKQDLPAMFRGGHRSQIDSFGADSRSLCKALLRDARGLASGPIDVALDMISAEDGA